jgi:hypothetical protein
MDTSKQIYTRSKEFLSKGNIYYFHHIDFVKKILEINIFTFITISLEKASFYILSQTNPNHILFRYVFKLNSYSENSIGAFVKLIKQIVSELEFDKLTGVFISKTKTNTHNKPIFFDEFGLNYVEKNLCVGCEILTTLKLQCDHFCCFKCFENILTSKECTKCKKKSSHPINQFKYYQLDSTDEFKHINKWINSNNFFKNFDFNLGYQLPDSTNNDWGDEEYSDEEYADEEYYYDNYNNDEQEDIWEDVEEEEEEYSDEAVYNEDEDDEN